MAPATGVKAGGTATVITGTGFGPGTTVVFGAGLLAVAAGAIVVVNPTTINCNSPAKPPNDPRTGVVSPGTVQVYVRTREGEAINVPGGFAYT